MCRIFMFGYLFGMVLALSSPMYAEESLSRALFVTVIQEPWVLSSRKQIFQLVDCARKCRIKTLFVQIYYANQAWFASRHADASGYAICKKNVREDPLQLLMSKAHENGIQVHAWMNLLSLNNNQNAKFLAQYGPDILTRNLAPKEKLEDYKIDRQYFLEASDERVREELVTIVEEVLLTYPDLDGIQFDYVRYPDAYPHYGYSASNIEAFKKIHGQEKVEESSTLWKNWKRTQVTRLLKKLVQKTRGIHHDIQISVTGCMPYSRAYHEAFQDWPAWINHNMVDFVVLMNYSPYPTQFERWLQTALGKIKNVQKIYVGIGAYKLVNAPQTFRQEFHICEKIKAGACVIFHYENIMQSERIKDFLTRDEGQKEKSFCKKN